MSHYHACDANCAYTSDHIMAEEIADYLEDEAGKLRGEPFRRGDVGIEYINGIEEAAALVRSRSVGGWAG